MTVWFTPTDGDGAALGWHPVAEGEPGHLLDDLARLAALVCDTPVALVSLVTADRRWFKARFGAEIAGSPWEEVPCPFEPATGDASPDEPLAARPDEPLVVADTWADARFAGLGTGAGGAAVRFYAGVPITIPLARRSGTISVVDLRPRTLSPSQAESLKALARQAAALQRLSQRVAEVANIDVVTGLPNRVGLVDELTRIQAQGGSAGMALVDLDGFRLVNNSWGHAIGDDVLRAVADRFAAVVGDRGLVARIEGDEFAFLARDLSREAGIEIARALIGSLSEPVVAGGEELYLSTSVGLAWTEDETDHPEVVLENADSALNAAKRKGRARWELYDDHLHGAPAVARRASALRGALRDHQLELYYQPIVDLGTSRVVSSEALMRWNHPQEGLIWPADFIKLAEANGSIAALGGWALRTACSEAARWGPTGISVSVNLSTRQLSDGDLYEVVAEALSHSGLSPARLVLEVTETTIMDDIDQAVSVLNRLKTLGVSLAVDDFGTGYSSLVYLQRLPVDELKVDRSFVDSLPDDAQNAAIVSSVISMAQAVGLKVVAEGVETGAQRDALLALHCDLGQGFLWGRPLPTGEATAFFTAAGAGAGVAREAGVARGAGGG